MRDPENGVTAVFFGQRELLAIGARFL